MIRVINGRITGQLECTWNDDVIIRLDPPWQTRLAEFAQLPADRVEVIPGGDREVDEIERRMVAAAQARIARRSS